MSPGLSFAMAELRVLLELQLTLFVAASAIETSNEKPATLAKTVNKDFRNAFIKHPPVLSIVVGPPTLIRTIVLSGAAKENSTYSFLPARCRQRVGSKSLFQKFLMPVRGFLLSNRDAS